MSDIQQQASLEIGDNEPIPVRVQTTSHSSGTFTLELVGIYGGKTHAKVITNRTVARVLLGAARDHLNLSA